MTPLPVVAENPEQAERERNPHRCETCRWYRPLATREVGADGKVQLNCGEVESGEEGDPDRLTPLDFENTFVEEAGKCVRFPPVILRRLPEAPLYGQPRVFLDTECGEWSAKRDAVPVALLRDLADNIQQQLDDSPPHGCFSCGFNPHRPTCRGVAKLEGIRAALARHGLKLRGES